MNLQVLSANTTLSIFAAIFILVFIGLTLTTIIQGVQKSYHYVDWLIGTIFYIIIIGMVFFGAVCNSTTCKTQQEPVAAKVVKFHSGGLVIVNSKQFPITNIGFYNSVKDGDEKVTLVTYYNFYGGIVEQQLVK
jgi:hypothetical protein